ncbi:hypothetical protein SETIT_2G326700v2 [Setaria italica]|uniref:Uncharacterized protein n=1 Tax=Setaria italica TaxID=4555 RepID=A0A368Q657_SETIT|nr:hypothetical protein SETIT_2G326700v2 [Setaria italica]
MLDAGEVPDEDGAARPAVDAREEDRERGERGHREGGSWRPREGVPAGAGSGDRIWGAEAGSAGRSCGPREGAEGRSGERRPELGAGAAGRARGLGAGAGGGVGG